MNGTSSLFSRSTKNLFSQKAYKSMNNTFPNLVDPQTKEPLIYVKDGANEYLQAKEGLKYPIVSGIPRTVDSKLGYTDAFGLQWNKWRATQLDSFTGTSITKTRLDRCLGEKLCNELSSGDESLTVLELGCGAGRFTEILLEFNAKVVSSDLSSAVDANKKNFPISSKHQIVQTDILKSSFGPNYNVVLCLGVIQHTPNTEEAIEALYSMVKPGGYLVIDHYTHDLKRFTKLALAFRPIVKRLPPKTIMALCEKLVDTFLPIHKATRNIPIAQALFSRVSPITSYYHHYRELSDQHQRAWAVLDTHDGLTDWHKRLRSPGRIKKTLQRINAEEVKVWKDGNGVEARCRKPLK